MSAAARRARRAARLPAELAEQADLVVGPLAGPADRAVGGREQAVVDLVALVDQRQVDDLHRLPVEAEVEVVVLLARLQGLAGLHVVAAAEGGALRGEVV